MAISFQNALNGKNEVAKQVVGKLLNDPRYLQQQEQQALTNLQAAMKKENDARMQDQPILDSLGKWGGGLLDVFRNSSKYFDNQMAMVNNEQRTMDINESGLIGSPQYRLTGMGPGLDYLGIIDAYKQAGKWNPTPSYQMMKDFNTKYGLGLTTDQIAKGVDKFGSDHRAKYGVNFIPSSNDLAIAMGSLFEGAGVPYGRQGAAADGAPMEALSKMWAEQSPSLAQWDQDAIKRQKDLAASFNSDIETRGAGIAKWYHEYVNALNKADDKETKAFTKQALATVAGAFVPGLGNAFGGGILGNAGAGALVGGGTAALTGGDIGKGILSGGLSGGLQGANFGGQAANALKSQGLGLGANALKAIGSGINSGLGAAGGSLINGASLGGALKSGLLSGAASGAGSYAGSTIGGLAKDAGMGNFLSKGLGSLAGGTTAGLIKGQTLGNALTGGVVGAGAGMLGDFVGGEFGKDAGGFASNVAKSFMRQKMMQKQQPQSIQQRRPAQSLGATKEERAANIQKMISQMSAQQRNALFAQIGKG